jgi:hypothetical protein
MNVTRQLNVECRLCKEDITLYIATISISFHGVSHMAQQDVMKKLQNKGQNILFIVIISRGDKNWENKNKETFEVSWDKSRGDENRKLKDEVYYI